jgi:hypothetical protein
MSVDYSIDIILNSHFDESNIVKVLKKGLYITIILLESDTEILQF